MTIWSVVGGCSRVWVERQLSKLLWNFLREFGTDRTSSMKHTNTEACETCTQDQELPEVASSAGPCTVLLVQQEILAIACVQAQTALLAVGPGTQHLLAAAGRPLPC